MKQELEQLLLIALARVTGSMLPEMPPAAAVVVERTRDPQHGDFATNVALRLAKAARRNPRELAEAIVAALPASTLIERAEVAGAGFINFRLAPAAYAGELAAIHERGAGYGESQLGGGERVLVEFVSANPTGPLHVGHGRQAAYGATLANVLTAAGFTVAREYYINDAGRQMDILAVSAWVRYLELAGETLPFPENGYRGDYVRVLAAELRAALGESLRRPAAAVLDGLPADAPGGDKEAYIDALIARARELIGAQGFRRVLAACLAAMLTDIREDLAEFGVWFDHWTSEREFADSGAIDHALVVLERAGLAAMGQPGECLEAPLIQFVSLYRGAEKIPMGKREAQFVTLRQLRTEVGNDACRFFYLMRSHDQPLDFDLELAKSRTNENPVYYIQYAHARVASVMKQLAARGLSFDRSAGLAAAVRLDNAHEQAVLHALVRYPEIIEQTAANRAPHALVHYLRDLANVFHTYYNAEQFIVEDAPLRNARLALVLGVQQVVRNGLTLLGVSAPESM